MAPAAGGALGAGASVNVPIVCMNFDSKLEI
jgi:hypothetical protein